MHIMLPDIQIHRVSAAAVAEPRPKEDEWKAMYKKATKKGERNEIKEMAEMRLISKVDSGVASTVGAMFISS